MYQAIRVLYIVLSSKMRLSGGEGAENSVSLFKKIILKNALCKCFFAHLESNNYQHFNSATLNSLSLLPLAYSVHLDSVQPSTQWAFHNVKSWCHWVEPDSLSLWLLNDSNWTQWMLYLYHSILAQLMTVPQDFDILGSVATKPYNRFIESQVSRYQLGRKSIVARSRPIAELPHYEILPII